MHCHAYRHNEKNKLENENKAMEKRKELKQELVPTSKISAACHAIPPAVTRSIPEIPSAPSVSNLPCPAVYKE